LVPISLSSGSASCSAELHAKTQQLESLQLPGDLLEDQPLVAEIRGVLQLLRIEPRTLRVPNTPTIRQRGHAAYAVTSHASVGASEADSVLGGQFLEAAAVRQVFGYEPAGALHSASDEYWEAISRALGLG